MDDDAVKNFIPFGCRPKNHSLKSVVFSPSFLAIFIAVRVDPFPTVDAGGDRIVFAMIMQLYPLDADRLVEVGNFYLRRVVRASRPLADREAIAAPLHLLRDGVPLVEIARMVCNLQPDASFSLKPVGWPFRLCVVGNTRDKVMTIFFFSIFRGVVCSKWRKFGHVSVSISKHAIINGAGGNYAAPMRGRDDTSGIGRSTGSNSRCNELCLYCRLFP